ncbi:hypothetical protein Pla52o_35310 [Novipirellula galeiformis]|uniref:SF3 helicase domain-containing protein n=1 Tax=Novipirellula galeiformis TaxID=2528004 RepID=A0A5C6CEN1_9BACT|nr:phage/plasmid primase, P4 family [Novipirellula galeiformis]TWU22475.1 hypothetical protein Pla52o_35310 [Novipirellula galeiformis]
MPRYDVSTVKQAATNRWPEIFYAVAGVPDGIMDGRHHPCPKCGGDDRFRLIDANEGACLCNQCFASKNGDGIAALQWLTGDDFQATIGKIATHLGVSAEKKRKKADPAEHLEFLPWNKTLAGMWCLKKKPIRPEAIQAIGGKFARYRGQYTVIAVPVWGSSLGAEPPVGYVLYRADGGHLPKWKPNVKEPEWTKVKLTAGSVAGIICNPSTFDDPAKVIWKLEGSTDLATLLSVQPDQAAFTTANGAKEKPLDWIVKLCEGRKVIVCHDADKPGQEGATWVPGRDGQRRSGWAPRLAEAAEKVVNLTLPFPVEPKEGPDVRDYFAGGGTFEILCERIKDAVEFGQTEAKEAASEINEAEDDPQRLARVNLERYKSEHDGRLVYWRDEWWKWKEGRYRKIEKSELNAKIWLAVRHEFEMSWRERRATGDDKPVKKVTRSLVSNVVGAMESMCSIASSISMGTWMADRSKPHYVAAKNGILDLSAVFSGNSAEECLLDHSPEWFSSFRLDYPFDAEAECPKWIDYLDYCMDGDQERIAVLQEWAGYLLRTSNDLQKFLVLEGEGGNGKTVYFAAMTAMLGESNVSHVSIENFDGRFELGTTIGKAANISGDAGEIDMVAEGVLKQFTGGDIMQFDRKNQTPISARPTAKLMAAWNSRPRIRDKSMGLWRRMLLIPFDRTIPQERRVLGMDKPDWWIEQGEAPGILLWAIVGLHRLESQRDFTRSQVSAAAMAEYREDSNPAGEFFSDYISEGDSSIESSRLYELYQYWCRKVGCKPLGSRQFGKELRRKFPKIERIKKRDGKKLLWSYEGINFSVDEIFSEAVEKENNLF